MMTKSSLNRTFETRWRQLEGPELIPEYRFAPPRLFRFDYCDPAKKIAIELEGGTWGRVGAKRCECCGQIPQGRHSTGVGMARDCEKYNLATLMGWRVFRFTTDMLEVDPAGHLGLVIELMRAENG